MRPAAHPDGIRLLSTDLSRLTCRDWLWWYCCELPCYVWVSFCYGFRAWGQRRVPQRGSVLIVANHQSFLDPILLGVATHHRPCHSLARKTLFANRFFAFLIRSLRAIPVDQEATDVRSLRRCIEILKGGAALIVYPEGARTEDGQTGEFAPGAMLLVRRARPMIVPAAIEGAAQAWPRGRPLPRVFGRIGVTFGQPIPAEQLLAMDTEQALVFLRTQVEQLRSQTQARLAGRP